MTSRLIPRSNDQTLSLARNAMVASESKSGRLELHWFRGISYDIEKVRVGVENTTRREFDGKMARISG